MIDYRIKEESSGGISPGAIGLVASFAIPLTALLQYFILASLMTSGIIIYFIYIQWYRNYQYIKRALKWKKVEGKISKKDVIKTFDRVNNTMEYIPYIRYEYAIENKCYSSKVISLFDESLIRKSYEEAKSILNELGNSKVINVYVNPQDHNESYLTNDYYKPYVKTKNREKDNRLKQMFLESLIPLLIFFIVSILYYIIVK